MKHIALTLAALGLSAGAALAATPAMNQPAQTQPPMQQSRDQMGRAQRSDWRANQETKALNLLEAQGFASFTDFRPAGGDQYAANVVRHGHDMTVRVDPADGRITRG